jgi:DNA-binding NarL/FixJ family response regulator
MPDSPPVTPIRVLLVDDHQIVRQAMADFLAQQADIAIVGQAENGQTALDHVARLRPDVVLISGGRPVLDGMATTRAIRIQHPIVRVIGVTLGCDPQQAAAFRAAGAAAYVDKTGPPQVLLAAVRAVRAP